MHQPFQQYIVTLGVDIFRLSIWLVLLLVIFVTLEKRWALHPRKLFRKAFGTDLIYYFVSGIVPKFLLILPLTLLAKTMHHFAGGDGAAYYYWVANLPLWIRLGAAMFVGEIGSYWGHRWSHEIPLLWRFHAIHHSAEEIDCLVNSRAHPLDMIFIRLCGLVPMYLLGLAQPMGNRVDLVPALVTVVGTIWGFFIHANVNWRFGWLEWLVSSPRFHHWHHTNDAAAHCNKNYASMLPWVDRCFGTFYLPEKQWPVKYGIDAPTPDSIAGQLIRPLSLHD